jgi:hypothetical protein
VNPLLEAICPGRVIRNAYFQQLGCAEVNPEPGNAKWRPPAGVNGVLHGHFLSPTSEDVIVSGNRHEDHSLNWGGTLLMTKRDGLWTPVWYRSGIITRHCMTVATGNGRQILVCESGISGMGHASHVLYSIELGSDDPVKEVLIATDAYDGTGEKQSQSIERVRLIETANGSFLRVQVNHARYECRKDWYECQENDFIATDPPPGEYTLDFELKEARLALSAASAALFGQLFPELAKLLPTGMISNGQPPLPR